MVLERILEDIFGMRMKKIINVINAKHRKKKSSSVVREEESEELKILRAKKELLLLEKEFALMKSNTEKTNTNENQESNIPQLQEKIIPATPIPEKQEPINSITLNPNYDNIPLVCPNCKGKLKRKKIRHEGNTLNQFIRCKKKCGFEKELVFHL